MNKFSKINIFFLPFLIYVFSFTIYNLFYFSFFQFPFSHLEQLQRLTLSRVVLQWQQITIHCRLSYCMRPHSLFISFLDILLPSIFPFSYGKYLSWIFIYLLHVHHISPFLDIYFPFYFPPYFMAPPTHCTKRFCGQSWKCYYWQQHQYSFKNNQKLDKVNTANILYWILNHVHVHVYVHVTN